MSATVQVTLPLTGIHVEEFHRYERQRFSDLCPSNREIMVSKCCSVECDSWLRGRYTYITSATIALDRKIGEAINRISDVDTERELTKTRRDSDLKSWSKVEVLCGKYRHSDSYFKRKVHRISLSLSTDRNGN